MKKPKLVDDWKRSWRWLSMQMALVVVAWGALPADTQAAIVGWAGIEPNRVPAFLGILVIVGRLIQQAAEDSKGDGQ